MFETTTKKVEKKYYWENMKYRNCFMTHKYESISRHYRCLEKFDFSKVSMSRKFRFLDKNYAKSILVGLALLFIIYLVIG